jgi:preprotein translocase subunit SecB
MTEPQQAAATFQIEKVYVKDLSLEIPHAPQVYAEQAQPQIDVRIESGESRFQQDYYEVTLSVTITARSGERTLFLVEAVQAGIFALRNIPEADLGPLLGIACRRCCSRICAKRSRMSSPGWFPPLLLTPISFEQLYLQRCSKAPARRASKRPARRCASRSSAREPGALRSPACWARASRSRSGRVMRSRRARWRRRAATSATCAASRFRQA